MSRPNDKTDNTKKDTIRLFKCLILTSFFYLHLFSTEAQTIFTTPVQYESFDSVHDGNLNGQSVDMDGDGDLDIVFTNSDFNPITFQFENFVHIRINDGLGGFGAATGLEALSAGVKVVLPFQVRGDLDIEDLNNDGLPDIVIVSGSSNTPFEVILNTSSAGMMSFSPSVGYGSSYYNGISIADINDDGNNDLILTTGNDSAELTLYFGDGSGTNWTSPTEINTSYRYQYNVVADFNGDDILDIMATESDVSRLHFFKGDSLADGSQAGTFQSDLVIDADARVFKLRPGDFNEDGFPDLVATDEVNVQLAVFINDGTGTSYTETSINGLSNTFGLDVNDINMDGHDDLIAAHGNHEISLLFGNGDGTFNRTDYPYTNPGSLFSILTTSGDYNGDGLTDMAAIEYGPHVFLNNTKPSLEVNQSGTGVANGESYDFGYISLGANSGAITFTIQNDGSVDGLLNGTPKIQVAGPQAAMFNIDESSTSATISSAANTTFTVTFTPIASDPGVNNAVISIPSNDPLSPYIINLTAQTLLQPDNVDVSASPICAGESTTLTQSNGIIGSGEQWVWYSGACGGTQEGVGESIAVSPSVTTDYFVRAETTDGRSLTGCTMGQVVISGEVITLTTPSTVIKTIDGEHQIFTVTATGTSPSYQWLKDGAIITDGGRISGSQTGTLVISTLEESDEATYTCEVTNFCSMESIAIALTVLQLPPNSVCGTALDFDGSNDYVDLGQIFSPLNTITLEAWVNLNQVGNHPIISRDGTDFARASPYTLQVDPTTISFSINTGPTEKLIVSKSLETNRWYHIACTYNGSSMRIYLDGEFLGSESHSGTLLNDNKLIIGAKAFFVGNNGTGGPRYANAKIDEVRIWDVARNQTDIVSTMTSALSGSESNLIGHWDFDEGVGNNNIFDKTSGGHNGTLKNMNASTDWLAVDGTIDDDNSNISVLACPDYLSPSGNFTWNTTGVYMDTLQTALGCDSIITVNLTIEPLDQLITFNSLPDAIYGDSDIALSATSSSGLPVSYASSDPTVATISGSTLSVIGAGTTTITASQTGDACTNSATNVLQNFSVNKAELSTTISIHSKSYGDPNPVFASTYSGFVNGEDAMDIDTPPTGTTIADETSDVGDYSITGSGGLDDNYSFSFVDGTLTIIRRTLVLEIISRMQEYGGVSSLEGYVFGSFGTDFVNGDDESDIDNLPVQTTPVVTTSPVGSYTIVATNVPNLDNNYDVVVVGFGTHTVTPAPLAATADNLSKVQGDVNPLLTFSYTGFVNGEDASALTSTPAISTTATMSSPAGDYPISLSGGSADNYDLTHINGTLTVFPPTPITVTVDPQSKVYGESDPNFTYQITSGTLMPGDNLTGSLSRVSGEDVATYAIEIGTLTAGPGYTITFVGNDLTITPKPITITAEAGQGKLYGQPEPALLHAITSGSLETGDVLSGSLERLVGESVGLYSIQQGTLTAGSNYTVTYVERDFVILAKPIIVTADANQTKVYGDTDPALSYSITAGSLEAGDVLTGNLDRTIGENVGNYAIGLGNLTAGGNYSISFIDAGFSITPKAITVTADANQTKLYGETDPVLSYTITSGSLEASDSFTGLMDRALGEDVGNYAMSQGTLNAGANYLMSFLPNDFSITQKPITVTPHSWAKQYGDPEPEITYAVTSGSLETGDSFIGALDRTPGEDVGNYTTTQGTLTAGNNYLITFVPNNFPIFQRFLFLTASPNQSKVYGGVDPVFTFTFDETQLIGGDVITGNAGRSSGEGVGSYPISVGTLDAGNNYAISFFPGNDFVIKPKTITISADAGQSKVYGTSDSGTLAYTLTGKLESGDGLTGSLDRVAGEDVANYTINQGTLTAGSNYVINYQNADFSILPAALSITADDQSRLYNEVNPTLTISYSGFVNGDDQSSINVPSISTIATVASNVGTYPIILTGGSAQNYSISNTDGTLTINQASQIITFNTLSNKTQGDADFSLTATASSGLSTSYVSSDPSVATISGGVVTILGSGTTTITASQAGDGNYSAASPVDQNLTVDALYIWNGIAWNNGSAPINTDDARIDSNYTFSTNGLFEANDLMIQTGVKVSINNENTLPVHGNLTNDGSLYVASGASLITFGTVSGTGYQIDRITTFDTNTGRYSIMGSPIQSANFTTLGTNALVYGYDELELYNPTGNTGLDRFKTPTQLSQTTMQVGQGYFSAFTGDIDGEVSFTGTPNTGTVNIPLNYTDHGVPAETIYQGFNLVSNPYPSAIDYNTLISENAGSDITGSIYLWDDNNSNTTRGSNADYVIVNSLGNTDSNNNGLTKWDGYIRSGQGFFVQANSPTNLIFNNTMRAMGNNSDGGFYRTIPTSNSIKLLLSDQNSESQKATIVGFVEDATTQTDKHYDAMSLSQSELQLYSLQPDDNQKLGIQGLPAGYQEEIKLGFKAAQGDYTISIANIKELIDTEVVLLKDHLTNRTINLRAEDYSFTTIGTESTDRFTLQISQPVISSTDQLNERVFYSYSIENELHVVFEMVGFETADIKLIDLTGQTVHQESTEIRSNRWQMETNKIPEGVYILMIETDYGVWKRRVITK